MPLGDTAALRFSGEDHSAVGRLLGKPRLPGETIGDRDLMMGRLQLALAPGDNFDLNLKVEGTRSRSEIGQPEFFGTVDPADRRVCAPILAGRIDNTQCTDLLGYTDTDGDPFKGDWAREGVYDIDNQSVTLTMNAALGAATLTSVSGYVDFDRTFDIDVDATPARELDFLETDAIKQYLAGVASRGERRAARLDRRRVLFEGRSGREHSGRARGSVLHAHAGHRRSGYEVRGRVLARRVASDRHRRSRDGPALHVGGAAVRRRHDRSEPDRLQLPAEPDVHAGLRRAVRADVRGRDHRGSQLVVARGARIPAAGVAAAVRDDFPRHEERRLLLRHLDHEPAARAVRAGRADRVRGRLQAWLRQCIRERRGLLLRLRRHSDIHRSRHRPVHHSAARQRRRGARPRARPRSDLGADIAL